MKQRIELVQLNELTMEQKEKLREWWEPEKGDVILWNGEQVVESVDDDSLYFRDSRNSWDSGCLKRDCFPLFSIGQMIEILEQKDECLTITRMITYIDGKSVMGWEVQLRHLDIWTNGVELADELLNMLKAIL